MSAPEISALRATVHGRVHGVGFRDFVVRRAVALRLVGYVRNVMPDRTVEVVAEGSRESLERLVEALSGGPGMARVDTVDVEWAQAPVGYTDFTVRR